MTKSEWQTIGQLPSPTRHETHYLERRGQDFRINVKYALTAYREWRDDPTPLDLTAHLPTCTRKENP